MIGSLHSGTALGDSKSDRADICRACLTFQKKIVSVFSFDLHKTDSSRIDVLTSILQMKKLGQIA